MADKEILNEIKQAKEDILKGRVVSYEEFFKKDPPQKTD
jgi:hypothetical protein